jgi:hypothetical protein
MYAENHRRVVSALVCTREVPDADLGCDTGSGVYSVFLDKSTVS